MPGRQTPTSPRARIGDRRMRAPTKNGKSATSCILAAKSNPSKLPIQFPCCPAVKARTQPSSSKAALAELVLARKTQALGAAV